MREVEPPYATAYRGENPIKKLSNESLKTRVEGFEPPTFWFVAKRSIQLGYTRLLGTGLHALIRSIKFYDNGSAQSTCFPLPSQSKPVDFDSTSQVAPARLASPLAAWQLGYTRLLRSIKLYDNDSAQITKSITQSILSNQDFISSLFIISWEIHCCTPAIFRKRCPVFYKLIYCFHMCFIL